MIDFVEYVVSELKNQRLTKTDALGLIKQFSNGAGSGGEAGPLHPLLHRNTSDLSQQSYATRFSGEEPFLRDHRIHGRPVLPGVAYLEMAYAAVTMALPDDARDVAVELRDIAWLRPVVLPEQRDIRLALAMEEGIGGDEHVAFEVLSGEDTVHFEGVAGFRTGLEPPQHDLDALRARISQTRSDGASLYAAMARGGVELGSSHQGVTAVLWGEQELLVEIEIPAGHESELDEYSLHPSMADSAVQAGMALLVEDPGDGQPPMPFGLERLRVFGGCSRQMTAWVRYATDTARKDNKATLDIDLCDTEGQVRAQLQGFSARVRGDIGSWDAGRDTGLLVAAPEWQDMPLPSNAPASAERHIIVCDLPGIDSEDVAGALATDSDCFALTRAAGSGAAEHFSDAALACFERVQAILMAAPERPVRLQVVVPDDTSHWAYQGLAALLRTAARENPKFAGQLLWVEPQVSAVELARRLDVELAAAVEPLVRYPSGDGQRQCLRWREVQLDEASAPVFNDGAVYLITGGLGGIGRLFAQEILARTTHAQVVLTGRDAFTEERQTAVAQLNGDGPQRVHYRQLNLTDGADVASAVESINDELGPLRGIVHAAGMHADGFILNKSAQQLRDVLAPKVNGTVHLDEATKGMELDFFALFSSSVSIFGNPAQADYAAANGFLDGFAAWRNHMRADGLRHGVTLALNWSLWEEGGMGVAAANQGMLERDTGMQPMSTANGLRAFHGAVSLGVNQLLVTQGHLSRLRTSLLGEGTIERSSAVSTPNTENDNADAGVDREQAETYLRKQFAAVLKLSPHKIDPQATLDRYGIDSILAMDLTTQLEESFGPLPRTLFFEYQSLGALTEYFLREHPQRMAELLSSEAAASPALSAVGEASTRVANDPSRAKGKGVGSHRRRRLSLTGRDSVREPIAIIGVSGRYPKAFDLEAFWANLRDGQDCITEVPAQRWDWREYYTEDRNVEGAHYSKWGGFIDGVDEFDPLFFNIPPVDADLIDPQERLFLQYAWKAVEDAGYTRSTLHRAHEPSQAGQVGVYVGVMYGEYQLFGAEATMRGKPTGVPVSYASVANRVSYVMNLHGPSMTLDTMCSSSLTAVHLACQDLRLGRTSHAIAGGVNVSIHPNKYLILSAGQYISGNGRCQSFGEGGDGYIPGEGVGAAVLKRLSEAERDGNPIYGLIRGSALNHGGKTNGYSVPNPQAQSGVIDRALHDSGVAARDVSYIEAHGTGTELGDPIEINALSQAFRQYTDERQFCAIGSVKSNVGHCESAAGIAGLTKVVLQMRHRVLAPSLHASVLNPHIDFESSPFVVNQELQNWEPPEVDGRVRPRIAGLSSFGAGGSNAHLIIEEYRAAAPAPEPQEPMVIPLSARTADQLVQKVRDLLAFLANADPPPRLQDIAYTLQLGRESMGCRLATVVDSRERLSDRLQAYLTDDHALDDIFRGGADRGGEDLSLFSGDAEFREAVEKWVARGKLAKLADLWVRGFDLDWRVLHTGRDRRLVSLPTYPFARDRYWLDTAVVREGINERKAPILHPLVHTNASDFFQQRYAAEFTGTEFFLADHRVRSASGELSRILPAVAYLEMVRAAVENALSAAPGEQSLQLRHVAWSQAMAVDHARRVTLTLSPSDDVTVEFQVETGETGQQSTVHCLGQAVVAPDATPQPCDLHALGERMSLATIEPDRIYRAFETMGIHYGRSFQTITQIRRGDAELLAELSAPSEAGHQSEQLVLHPAVLDGALQAAIALAPDFDGLGHQPSVPFALDSLTVSAPCPSRVFAWVRYASRPAAGDSITRLNVDLYDQTGRPCVQMTGLASRQVGTDALGKADRHGVLVAVPDWQPITDGAASASDVAVDQHWVVLGGIESLDPQRLQTELAGIELEHIRLGDEGLGVRYQRVALTCFERLQAILRDAPQQQTLFQLVVTEDSDHEILAGVSGLLESARLENARLAAQLVLVSPHMDEHTLAQRLRLARARSQESQLKCREDASWVRRWRAGELEQPQRVPLRAGGVYLITGGLGGLGRLFAQEILCNAEGSVVLLTGRSELTRDKDAALKELAAELEVSEQRLVYRRLDVTEPAEVEALVSELEAEYGQVTGILHTAGMIRDQLLRNKSAHDFAEVLEPKVQGTVNLDWATRGMDLDFLALFSSVSAAVGNVGQSDYATANGFMDQFATYRNELAASGQRAGTTVSLDWPLWQEGGMQLDPEELERLTEGSGMVPLQTANGIAAFYRSLTSASDQTLIMEGELERLSNELHSPHAPLQASESESAAAVDVGEHETQDLQPSTEQYLIDEFSSLLRIPRHEVDPRAPLEDYGMDSVLAMKFTDQLERRFGTLSKTLLFEHQTLASLAGYLLRHFPDAFRPESASQASTDLGADHRGETVTAAGSSGYRRLPSLRSKPRRDEPMAPTGYQVAIVGLTGRYPQANDISQFWANLKEGRDCITEIPTQRWDHEHYFHPQRNQPGQTYTKWGGFVDGVDHFDALFFNISPREAELMDPQERLALETVWETIEEAGYGKEAIAQGNYVGVYMGVMWGQYELYGAEPGAARVPSSSFASVANRVSYFFDFQGPSLALDTMCSSSLTALHLAAEEIRRGELDVAIAGGVNVSIHPNKYLSLGQGNFASTDGRCRAFGEGGDGYVPGEGVGAVMLKSLDRALHDGDHVHGVIKASAINHGGKTNGYTVPNPKAQSRLIQEALRKAGVDPGTIGYVEAHGTGTALGDPIELTGLQSAFEGVEGQPSSPRKGACAIGSVKSNIGHLESAAGIAALTKALLQMQHGQLVPSLHTERLNPNIDFESTPFRVQRTLEQWPRPEGHPRRTGVSSFGAGGSNAHLILEEFVDNRLPVHNLPREEAFLLSAKTPSALQAYAERMLAFLDEEPNASLTEIAYTSQVGRTPMPERLAIIASGVHELRDKLRRWLSEVTAPSSSSREANEVGGVYKGSTKSAGVDLGSLIAGDAGEAFLQRALEQRDLGKLARLWIAGASIDWDALHAGQQPRRLSMPTYPFEREPYWIDTGAAPREHSPAAPQREVLYYEPAWQNTPLGASPATTLAKGPVLVLGGTSSELAELRRALPGLEIVPVRYPGDANGDDATDRHVDPRSEEQLTALVEEMASDEGLPTAIVHRARTPVSLDEALDRGLHALHGICRALLSKGLEHGARIVSLRPPLPPSAAAAHQALAGYFQSLAQESTRFGWKVLAMDRDEEPGRLAQILAQEVCERDWRDGTARYRSSISGGDSQREMLAIQPQLPPNTDNGVVPLKQRGVYLVTGGLGGLGYLVSQHLAEHYHARLVLTGRSELNQDARDKLDALRALGAEAVYLTADVAEPDQVKTAVADARARFAGIDGVVHAAGTQRDALAMHKNRADIDAVLAGKVMGTVHLDHATRNDDLDLFVLFASAAGIFGNSGQADYAFANRFQDAFAANRQALLEAGERSGKSLSIDWPYWAEGAMEIATAELERTEQRTGIAPLPTDEGLRSWTRLLQSEACQGIPIYGDTERITYYLNASHRPATEARHTPDPPSRRFDIELLQKPTEAYLKSLLSEQLKLPAERIDSDDGFEHFGVDSVIIGQIMDRLDDELGEQLSRTLFYEYPTVADLTSYLVRQVPAALAQRFGLADNQPEPTEGVASEDVAAEATDENLASNARQELSGKPVAPQQGSEPRIAIIGLDGQFPQSESLDEYWQNLRDGHDLIEPVPESRWDRTAFFDPDTRRAHQGMIYCTSGAFLRDVDRFDASFFNIPADDARMIDPQERLFMQSVWSALEDAGYTRDALRRRHPKGRGIDGGVFVGVTTNSYQQLTPEEWRRGNMVNAGSMPWSIANRVSYFFDFQGPSLPIDTACSSSLAAIHLARESLQRGESQVAVAGGVNLYLHPAKYQSMCRSGMLAAGGQCRSFGYGDDGFIPGEALGTVVLKPLAQAIEDRDHVHGVIAGSACDHAGRANGYSAPNPTSQARVIQHALESAVVDPETIGYVEGHGTATQMGDSLEVVSLTQAFRQFTDRTQYCPLGSVKSNLGHSESAAGMAAVAKVLLQLKHGQIAPTIHADPVNPNIDFESSPFYLQQARAEWPTPAAHPRRALINSFGAGGVNASIVLEDHPSEARRQVAVPERQLIVLSALDADRLRERARDLRQHVLAHPHTELSRVTYTLQAGREAMPERLAMIVSSIDELSEELSRYVQGEPSARCFLGRAESNQRNKAGEEERRRAKALADAGDVEALAGLWVEGQDIEWDDLYEHGHPQRAPLPTYPFAPERYWVSDTRPDHPDTDAANNNTALEDTALHPLVMRNVSTLRETAFSSSFSANGYFGREHRINDEPLFPAAAYLEMAVVAGAIAGEAPVARLEDIAWMKPITLNAQHRTVRTILRQNGTHADCSIVSSSDNGERATHAEARLCFTQRRRARRRHSDRDLDTLRQKASVTNSGSECYQALERFGFSYGERFRTIEHLWLGDGFALSRLCLTGDLQNELDDYILHPTLLDGALQTVLGLATEPQYHVAFIPFAADALEIDKSLPAICYAYVERSDQSDSHQRETQQFNIEMLSETGERLVRLDNFYVRALSSQSTSVATASGEVAVID